jgi:hypothetical protein
MIHMDDDVPPSDIDDNNNISSSSSSSSSPSLLSVSRQESHSITYLHSTAPI